MVLGAAEAFVPEDAAEKTCPVCTEHGIRRELMLNRQVLVRVTHQAIYTREACCTDDEIGWLRAVLAWRRPSGR